MQGLLSSLLKQIGCKAPVSFPHGNKNHLQTAKIDMNTNYLSMYISTRRYAKGWHSWILVLWTYSPLTVRSNASSSSNHRRNWSLAFTKDWQHISIQIILESMITKWNELHLFLNLQNIKLLLLKQHTLSESLQDGDLPSSSELQRKI